MKTLKLFILALASISLYSCDGYDAGKCRGSIVEAFPKAKAIQNIEGGDYRFVVVDSIGNVFYAETMNLNDNNITTKELIYLAPKQ